MVLLTVLCVVRVASQGVFVGGSAQVAARPDTSVVFELSATVVNRSDPTDFGGVVGCDVVGVGVDCENVTRATSGTSMDDAPSPTKAATTVPFEADQGASLGESSLNGADDGNSCCDDAV